MTGSTTDPAARSLPAGRGMIAHRAARPLGQQPAGLGESSRGAWGSQAKRARSRGEQRGYFNEHARAFRAAHTLQQQQQIHPESDRLLPARGGHMKSAVVRTVQIGVALIIVTAVIVATLVITGVMSRDAGVEVAIEVAAVIAICMVAGIALAAVFGLGGERRS